MRLMPDFAGDAPGDVGSPGVMMRSFCGPRVTKIRTTEAPSTRRRAITAEGHLIHVGQYRLHWSFSLRVDAQHTAGPYSTFTVPPRGAGALLGEC